MSLGSVQAALHYTYVYMYLKSQLSLSDFLLLRRYPHTEISGNLNLNILK